MPSLKALRTRINSVKSTQKITSAMKMVAASKLRRAQRRPKRRGPMPSGWSACCARWRRRSPTCRTRRRCWPAPARTRCICWSPVTADRGLAGAFNRRSAAPTRTLARALEAQGKTVKILAVGRKGRDYLRRELGQPDHRRHLLRRQAAARIRRRAAKSAQRITAMLDAGEFDVCTLIYNRFQSVISQIVDRAAADSRAAAAGRRRRPTCGGAALRIRAGRGNHPGAAAAAGAGDQIYRGAAGKRRRRAWRADDRDGQRDPQRRRHDQAADAELQPRPPGEHHQGTDRDHLRRRSRSDDREGHSTHGQATSSAA